MGNIHRKLKKKNINNNNKKNNDNIIKKDKDENEGDNIYPKDKFKFIKFLNQKHATVINISLLNDGRICVCHTHEIYIYNNVNEEEPQLIIPTNSKCHCQIQLKNNLLVLGCCSLEIIKLEENNTYKSIQLIQEENTISSISSMIEIPNSNFIISVNNSIKIYKKIDNSEKYEFSQKFDTSYKDIYNTQLCLIKDNQFVCAYRVIDSLRFYNFSNEKISLIFCMNNIECSAINKSLCVLNNTLIVGGKNRKGIYLINLKNYSLIGVINGLNIIEVYTIYRSKNINEILVGLMEEKMGQNVYKFKYENNTLVKIKELPFCLDYDVIYGVIELSDNKIVFGSYHGRTVVVQ
jgi:hypothetical protein